MVIFWLIDLLSSAKTFKRITVDLSKTTFYRFLVQQSMSNIEYEKLAFKRIRISRAISSKCFVFSLYNVKPLYDCALLT